MKGEGGRKNNTLARTFARSPLLLLIFLYLPPRTHHAQQAAHELERLGAGDGLGGRGHGGGRRGGGAHGCCALSQVVGCEGREGRVFFPLRNVILERVLFSFLLSL